MICPSGSNADEDFEFPTEFPTKRHVFGILFDKQREDELDTDG